MKKSIYQKRLEDWRNGAIVYQVLVDRFEPSQDIDTKKTLYQFPRTLRDWHEQPKPGHFVKEAKYWSHELDYWGGDLKSLMSKLDYIKQLNLDVLYLNPIFESVSNHKYDASDYLKISKEYGTHEDLKLLTEKMHQMGMKLMLDGVFNHVGVSNTFFQEALKNPSSPYRKWFDFNDKYPEGVRLWADAKSLPELNLEDEAVKNYIYKSEASVLKTYLDLGVDGWRLDVAFDIGYEILKDLTEEAHRKTPGSMIVGEIWNYPEKWLKSIDGVMNFTLREIMYGLVKQKLSSKRALEMVTYMIHDAGIEPILKSWNVLDNHDVTRLLTELPKRDDQKLAQVLQFTLPGAPNLYYGTELGMDGKNDPENRAPMHWNLNNDSNEILSWTKGLIDLHQSEIALKVGDYRSLLTDQLFGFERYTDDIKDLVIVIVNPTDHDVTESVMIRNSSVMNFTGFKTLLGETENISCMASMMTLTLKKKSFVVLKPDVDVKKSYTPYKRV